MKQRIKRGIGFLLALAVIFALFPISAFAVGFSSEQSLPTSWGSTLYNGYIYRVNGNTTISAGTGSNALNVAGGATVVIYIPSGYTLTVYGGSGSATTPGGAGIYLPSNSTLILAGGGRLVAYGGNAGSGGSGYNGSSGQLSVGGNWFKGGSGGSGGYGGGGAGAGIGGSGGYGGSGGSGGSCPQASCYHPDGRRNGGSGYIGSNGSNGNSMGTLYILNQVSVVAYGGVYGSYGYGGNWASDANDRGSGWKNNYTASGGSGGGGGGAGAIGYDFGSGGYGGGGGGGGGAGGTFTDSGSHYYTYADGGYAGYGYITGNRGVGGRAVHAGYSGGYGGGSGSSGNWGSHGYIYKAPTASITGGRYGIASGMNSSYSSIPNAVGYQISLDNQGGYGGSTINVSYGTYLPTINMPTKSQYAFMGYYTSPNGSGTRYYDQRGAGLFSWERASNLTLYAYWVQNQFNVTFDRQTGSGGTSSIITSGTDGTLPSIAVPTRQYFAFNGYFDKAAGAGTKYYDSVGTPVTGRKITFNSVLYASWTQNQFRASFNRQGATNGDASVITPVGGALPTITPPSKLGYVFDGYWTQSTGGVQMYNANGTTVAGKKLTADTTLYAHWNEARYNITYVMDGGSISGNPTSRLFTANAVIPNPTKTDYSFLGWQVDSSGTRSRDLTIPGNSAAYAKNITLTAAWAKTMDTDVEISGGVQVATGNDAELKEDLKDSFETMVTDPAKGVTTDDLAGDKSVKLVLSVNESQDQTGHGMIGEIAQGTALTFYDIKATKKITSGSGSTSKELVEIPSPVSVKIPISGDLAGKTAYRVYRVHDGVAEPLPVGPTTGEYYNVEDGNIVIRTRKFSTYGVVGAETQMGVDVGEIFKEDTSGVDVQGRVIESTPALLYKVDIAWGAMKFEYSMDKEWNPDTHMYSEGALNAWRPVSFDGENNRIRTMNHSNGAVKLNLAVTQNNLMGVNMSLHIFNEATAVEAANFILPEAPIGSTNAELEQGVAYLFLKGSPEASWINNNKDAFTQVGVITATVEPYSEPQI